METEEKIKVMQHYANGGLIEKTKVDTDSGWEKVEHPIWNWEEFEYRIAVTKPSIDWSHVSEEYNYLATNENGVTYLYTDMPKLFKAYGLWASSKGKFTTAKQFTSFKPGNCPYKKSLVERPK